ncbi:phage major capsid protein [Streptomyces sp. NPDC056683]|uniref:phage major capsid protein n=1 Tax=Streptomyces sp. NPDC056683 TaxID=3345910 RepID=UPI0036CD3AEF
MSTHIGIGILESAIKEARGISPQELVIVANSAGSKREACFTIANDKTLSPVAKTGLLYEALTENGAAEPAPVKAPETVSEAPAEERTTEEIREERSAAQRAAMAAAGPLGKLAEERKSFIVPGLNEYRALSGSSPSAGGYLVPIGQADQVFDLLRAKSVLLGSGVRILPMMEQTLNVPRVATATTVSMVAEGANITPADMSFAQATLSAKKAVAFTLLSNESLADTNPAIRAVVTEDHIKQLALKLDAQFLFGDGTGQNMKGIRNFSGANATSLGTNGASLSLDALADAAGRLEQNNGNLDSAVWVMSGRSWASIRKLKDGMNRYQLSPDPSQDGERRLFGIPVLISNQISNAETVGSSNTCSWIGLIDTTQVVVGQRQDIVLNYSFDYAFNADQTAIRTTARYDIQPLDPHGVELVTGVLP